MKKSIRIDPRQALPPARAQLASDYDVGVLEAIFIELLFGVDKMESFATREEPEISNPL